MPGLWVCVVDGHIEVDRDRTCLVCERQLIATDRVGKHVTRDHGELSHRDDVAINGEW